MCSATGWRFCFIFCIFDQFFHHISLFFKCRIRLIIKIFICIVIHLLEDVRLICDCLIFFLIVSSDVSSVLREGTLIHMHSEDPFWLCKKKKKKLQGIFSPGAMLSSTPWYDKKGALLSWSYNKWECVSGSSCVCGRQVGCSLFAMQSSSVDLW